jgi:predicted lipid-binding transport protein (Tim44 family)
MQMNELGLLDYLLIAFSLAFSWRMYHSAQPPPAGIENPAFQPSAGAGKGVDKTIPPQLAEQGLDAILKRIVAACRYPDIDAFLAGARQVYEMVTTGFAAGRLDGCAYLLSSGMRDDLAEAIAARQARGERAELVFIGFREAAIAAAGLNGARAWIDVRFAAELVSVTRNSKGEVVSGSAEQVVVTSEIWTFERDLEAGAPEWLLVATDVGG